MPVIFTLLLSLSTFAQSFGSNVPGVDNLQNADVKNPLKITAVSSAPENIQAGSRFPITLQLSLPAGFHAYEDKFKVKALFPDGAPTSEIVLKGSKEFVDYGGKPHKGLVENGALEFFVELPQDTDPKIAALTFDLEYIACTKKFCLPRNTVSFDVPVHMKTTQTESKASTLEEKLQSNLILAFLLVFGFGFLTSLTPCVYPLVPITLAVIGARTTKSTKREAFTLSLVYVLGIAFTYSLLGVIAAKTGALFGQALSYPPVIVFFAFLFFLMGLSLFGLFEIRLPHALTQKLSGTPGGKGYGGAFVAGLIAGVIASPCVGPVLVSILAYIAKTQDVVLGFSLLFTFAMGMGVLFIALGTSSSMIKKLPKSGPWMNGIKYALGVMMILLGLYYLKPIVMKQTQTAGTSATASTVPLKNGWQLYSEDLMAKAKAEGKPVMIDFFADWCGACVELDEKSFSQASFIEASKDFYILKVDATENAPGLTELQQKYNVFGLPTVVFVSKTGVLLNDITLTGFEEAEPIIERMKRAQAAP